MEVLQTHQITGIRNVVLQTSNSTFYENHISFQRDGWPTELRCKNSLVLFFIWSSRLSSTITAPLNKITFTNDWRLFTFHVRSSKNSTNFLYACITINHLSTRSTKLLFYRDYPPLLKQMSGKLDFDFVPCLDFEKIKKLRTFLLVFDDSCEELYQKNYSVKIATAGRDNKHCVFVKHISSQQSKCRAVSTSIQLTSFCSKHLETFKIWCFRDTDKHNGNSQILLQTRNIRTIWSPNIRFWSKRSDLLFFRSNIVGHEPTIFYLPSSLAKETLLLEVRRKSVLWSANKKRSRKFSRKQFLDLCYVTIIHSKFYPKADTNY